MMEPLDARIWHGNTPVWGGTIPASRFRLCPPGEQGRWSQLSGCDIVNVFIPVDLVNRLALRRGDGQGAELAARKFVADRTVLDLVRRMLDARALAGPLAPVCAAARHSNTLAAVSCNSRTNRQAAIHGPPDNLFTITT